MPSSLIKTTKHGAPLSLTLASKFCTLTKVANIVHDTPQHNGVAERRNRTIVERIQALLHSSGLPKSLWGEAARHVVWLMNRTSTKAVDGMTPYEATFSKKPNLGEVREWGEKVWVRIEGGDKLGGRVREGRWLGVDEKSKGVRVYWPDSKMVSVERATLHISNKTRVFLISIANLSVRFHNDVFEGGTLWDRQTWKYQRKSIYRRSGRA